MRKRSGSDLQLRRRRKFSPLALVGVIIPVILMLIVATVFILPRITHAANTNINGDCTLIVPAHPLTARGLATPYQLVATNPDNGPCNETNKAQAAFVQAAVIDPANGQIAIYNPLVVDKGTKPFVAPVVPQLPVGGIVAIWFGSNGNTLTLKGSHDSLNEGNCVNGIQDSIFGQFSYCNAPQFFEAAKNAIKEGKLVPPTLGKARDGLSCPTVRDFSVVDQDQSDNVTTTYLINDKGQTAQMTAANAKLLTNSQTTVNGSDNRLVSIALDGALGCTPWMAPDLADPGHMTTGLPLNELLAAKSQTSPVALVPARDPMVLVDNTINLDKLNAYRQGVNQPTVDSLDMANTRTYCKNLYSIAPARLQLDATFTKVRPSPDPAVADSLFTFLAQRFVVTFEANGLNCQKLLGKASPISVQTDSNGVAVNATIRTPATPTINCVINGTKLTNCTGTATINGQDCSFTFDQNASQVNLVCPAKP